MCVRTQVDDSIGASLNWEGFMNFLIQNIQDQWVFEHMACPTSGEGQYPAAPRTYIQQPMGSMSVSSEQTHTKYTREAQSLCLQKNISSYASYRTHRYPGCGGLEYSQGTRQVRHCSMDVVEWVHSCDFIAGVCAFTHPGRHVISLMDVSYREERALTLTPITELKGHSSQ